MKRFYRGYEISVTREMSLGGDKLLYYSIFRQEDGKEMLYFPEDSAETVLSGMHNMIARVDAELAEDDPWMERAEAEA